VIQFTKPENLNGAQLLRELAAEKIIVTGKAYLDDNLILWLDLPEKDKAKATGIVNAHIGVDEI
jgi:hypothetical protein